jgi:AcrR family transcriptional regulator
MVQTLGKEQWIRASRLALLRGGVQAVSIERLARGMKVTKGSFYWHFKDRAELLETLLREWEDELSGIITRLRGATGRDGLSSMLLILAEQASLSERGKAPSDAAVFAWAAVSPETAARVNKAEAQRIAFLARLTKSTGRAELLYLTWLGFVARGQRSPETRKRFPRLASSLIEMLSSERGRAHDRKRAS